MAGTVQSFITNARVLLQDTVEEYRYSDEELLVGLNMALLEARRLRPDFFVEAEDDPPQYTLVDATEVEIDPQFYLAFLHFVVGHAQLRDEEDVTDARASAFLQSFAAKLGAA